MSPLAAIMKRLHAPVMASRLRVLSECMVQDFQAGDSALDIGCGGGALAKAILDHPRCPEGVTIRGAERFKREGEPIEVDAYDGERLPYDDNSFDVVIIADVLHHDEHPMRLLQDAARVCRRTLIIKDHIRQGLVAQWRISLMDWAANHPYGVKCLYRYYSRDEWRDILESMNARIVRTNESLPLYPVPYRWFFTPGLQYVAVLDVRSERAESSPPA